MLTWLTLLSVATAPAGLTLSAQLGKTKTPPTAYLDAVEQELVGAGLPVRRLTTTCDGARECLVRTAQTEKLAVIVGVSLAHRRKQTTLDIEALRAEDGAAVAQLTFTVSERLSDEDRLQVRGFALRVKEALPPPSVADAPVREPDRPLQPVLVVTASDPERPPPAPAPAPRSRAPAWILLSGAGATAVTAGVFLGLATAARGPVEATQNPSLLPRPEVEALASRANRDYTIALVTGAVTGALLAGALVWLIME